jgi:hypothetical protein
MLEVRMVDDTGLRRGAAAWSIVAGVGWFVGLSIAGKSLVVLAATDHVVIVLVAGGIAGVLRAGAFDGSVCAALYMPTIAALAVVTSGYVRLRGWIILPELAIPAVLVLPLAGAIERRVMRRWRRA